MSSRSFSSGDLVADRRADYARGLADAGAHGDASDVMRQALELAPSWAAGWFTLGGYLEKTGNVEAASDAFRTVLRLTPEDVFGAGLKLAALGQAAVPSAAPSAYVARLFDDYAVRFDRALVEKLGYTVPERLLGLLRSVRGDDVRFAHAVDLGCGTGLMGERLRGSVSYLEGYDLSPGMLAKARAKGIYDHLDTIDLSLPLPEEVSRARSGVADLVTAADVVIYLGDLGPVFSTAAALLAAGGLFAFSVEHAPEGCDRHLRASLRYAHSDGYVRSAADAAGLALIATEIATIRRDGAEAITGRLCIAERRPERTRDGEVASTARGSTSRLDLH